jgi:hypothetical protein
MYMKKVLKFGIPVLVAVMVLIMGSGIVLAKNDVPGLTGSKASYDGGYWTCPGAYYGPGGRSGDNDANYQPPCHGYWR